MMIPVAALVALPLGLPADPDALAMILAAVADSDTSTTDTTAMNAQPDLMH